MLYVNFYDEQRVSFTVIGNRYVLGDWSVGMLKDYKKAVSELASSIHGKHDIDFEPIDEYLEANKDKYGKEEDWEEAAKQALEESALYGYSALAHAGLSQGKRASRFARFLVDSPDENIRAQVARHGFFLKKLCRDKSTTVRCAVAERGYGLDSLVSDEDPTVRREVANQGYGLERLSKDRITDVRVAVVKQGYKLDEMIKDKSPHVRGQVAKMGYGLDILEKEDSAIVKKCIREYKKSMGLD